MPDLRDALCSCQKKPKQNIWEWKDKPMQP